MEKKDMAEYTVRDTKGHMEEQQRNTRGPRNICKAIYDTEEHTDGHTGGHIDEHTDGQGTSRDTPSKTMKGKNNFV